MNETRLSDYGPRYKETPEIPNSVTIAEPFNTVTASLFIFLAVLWAFRLRGRYRKFPMITCCLPVLSAGGIGGTLYHATRASKSFFLMDIIPIFVLGIIAAGYLVGSLAKELGRRKVLSIAVGLVGWQLLTNYLIFAWVPFDELGVPHLRISASYATFALLILIPISVVLIRTHFRESGWVFGALICFAQAFFFRTLDNTSWDGMPMGTHWLWHINGALTTYALTEYFYRLEGGSGDFAMRA